MLARARRNADNGMKVQALWLFGWLALLGVSGSASAQVGYDRPGGDYTSAPSRSGDPAQCAARCERDSRCRAWAFSYPATENANAICWLKSRVTPRVAATCCVSGVRGAGIIQLNSGPIEFAIDRSGGDYRHFELPPDPAGPGLTSGRAILVRLPSATSKIASPGRSEGLVASPVWCVDARSMVPKMPVPDLIRDGTGFRKDHAQTKS
jgi:hypothetical protein